MVATPRIRPLSVSAPERARLVRASAARLHAEAEARRAFMALRRDLERARRLHLLSPAGQRLFALHRSLSRPGAPELPERIDGLLELAEDEPAAAMAVGLDPPRQTAMAARAARLRVALGSARR